MELYAIDRDFQKAKVIDEFESAIWTERYFGAGDFELNVPANVQMLTYLSRGRLMMCEDSDIPMILEHREIKDGLLKVTGIDLLKWLNNRPFRADRDHRIKELKIDSWIWGGPVQAGRIINWIVETFCTGPAFPDTVHSIPTGIPLDIRVQLPIPGLVVGDVDLSGPDLELTVPYGQIYDTILSIAEPYDVGMNIKLDYATESDYQISFNTYSGDDRTSGQSVNDLIQFSPEMDTFTNITDLDSISNYINLALIYGSEIDYNIVSTPGWAWSVLDTTNGFDLRVSQEWIDNLDITGLTGAEVQALLDEKAERTVAEHRPVQLVDGEVVPNDQIKYGTDYFLGDIVEVVGNFGGIQNARITEYIRSQDSAGERAYPGLTMIDE